MRTLYCLAFATALCASFTPLDAQPAPNQWRPIYRDAVAQFFVDPSTLERQGHHFTIMARAIFHEPQDGIASFSSQMLYDCTARTLVILHLTQLRPDGSVALDGDTGENDRTPDPVAPDSANAAMLNEYCTG